MEFKYDVYTASPLFSETEQRRCGVIEKMCKDLDLKFFAPRLGTAEEGKMLGKFSKLLFSQDFSEYTKEQVLQERDKYATAILNANIEAINNSAIMIACIDNRDPGTMFEIGYAVAHNKPVITYSFENYGSNIMISQSTIYHANITEENTDELGVNTVRAANWVANSMQTLTREDILAMRKTSYRLKDMELE